MFGAILILFLLPWLDTSKVRSAKFRPIYKQLFWVFLLCCVGLWYAGGRSCISMTCATAWAAQTSPALRRSEEHTSELQSLMRISYAVFCLKQTPHQLTHTTTSI